MSFSKVIYDPGQKELAKVDRSTGTLYLNSKIWQGLPKGEQEFILFHEDGHLTMQTADEFKANEYAIEKFAPVRTLTNNELGQRIVVMRDAFTKATTSNFGILGFVSAVANVLPVLGIGSGSRIKETEAKTAADTALIEAQAKATQQNTISYTLMAVIAGVLIIVGISLYFILKK